MGISSLSMGQSLPLSAKVQATVANRSGAIQKAELPDDVTTVAKQNYDVATISEEGKAAAQTLNATPVVGSSSEGLLLDAVGESSEPSHVVVVRDTTDYAAQKRSDAWSRAYESRQALDEKIKNVSFCSYDSTTGLYYINMSAFDRYWRTSYWEWQEDLRVNDPEAYEAWVSHFGVKEKPKFSTSSEGDVYQVIDLTPDADGYTDLDYVYMKLEQMKSLVALIEEQFRESKDEDSDDSSVTERIETQSAELKGDLQANNSEVSETQTDISADNDSQQQERQSS